MKTAPQRGIARFSAALLLVLTGLSCSSIGHVRADALDGSSLITQGQSDITSIQQNISSATSALIKARGSRDILCLNGLNDILSREKSDLSSAQSHQSLLQSSVSMSDLESAAHELLIIDTLRQHTDSLAQQSLQLSGISGNSCVSSS